MFQCALVLLWRFFRSRLPVLKVPELTVQLRGAVDLTVAVCREVVARAPFLLSVSRGVFKIEKLDVLFC